MEKKADIPNKLEQTINPAGYQYQDRGGYIHQLEDLSRDDLLQIACGCINVIEALEEAADRQKTIIENWRIGGTSPN